MLRESTKKTEAEVLLEPLFPWILLMTVVVLGWAYSVSEPGLEIVNGVPFATDIPGLDYAKTVNVSQSKIRLGQTIRFARLVPVPDQPEGGVKPPSEVYSAGREDQYGSALPPSYYPVLSERDLMERLFIETIPVHYRHIFSGRRVEL